MSRINNITVVGDGGWGTTIAIHLSKKGFNVNLWGVFPDYLKLLDDKRENQKFLPGIKIPDDINISKDVNSVIDISDLIVLAVPSKYMRSVIKKISGKDFTKKIILSTAKGIEENTFMRMSEVINDTLGNATNIAILSGPTIAHEVASDMPAACVIASENKRIGSILQDVFNSTTFRVYTNSDVVGVELYGALKNIIAVAAGISDGIGYGVNTKAALLTRASVEISRLGQKLGAHADTFKGLAGMGDLITTCFSARSRNRSFGEAIGKGKTKDEIVNEIEMVIEGVTTVKAVYELSEKLNIDLPITAKVYQVLYEQKPALEAVNELMTRETKVEYL